MEIFILLTLAFIVVIISIGMAFVILRKKPGSRKKWEIEKVPDKKTALLDNEEPLHHYDPSYLGSPLYKIRKSKND